MFDSFIKFQIKWGKLIFDFVSEAQGPGHQNDSFFILLIYIFRAVNIEDRHVWYIVVSINVTQQ